MGTGDRWDKEPWGQWDKEPLGCGTRGHGDTETAVSPRPVPQGPRSAAWLLPIGGIWGSHGIFWEAHAATGLPRALPPHPCSPSHPSLAPARPPGCCGLCVRGSKSPKLFRTRGLGRGNKKQDGGKGSFSALSRGFNGVKTYF